MGNWWFGIDNTILCILIYPSLTGIARFVTTVLLTCFGIKHTTIIDASTNT